MGDHYFVSSPSGTGISPVWDFRAFGPFKGNANAMVLAAKVGDLPSPAGSQNVDWLQLKSVSGELATQVRRTSRHFCQYFIHAVLRYTGPTREVGNHPLQLVLHFKNEFQLSYR